MKAFFSVENLDLQFWRIHTFWNVLNSIWKYMKNVCLSMCLPEYEKHFTSSVTQKLMHLIPWNFTFSCIRNYTAVYQLLMEMVNVCPCCYSFPKIFGCSNLGFYFKEPHKFSRRDTYNIGNNTDSTYLYIVHLGGAAMHFFDVVVF